MAWARVGGPGEPDAVCDAIASAIAEEYVRRDPSALLDIRVNGGPGAIFVVGTVQSSADFDVAAKVKQVIGQIDPGLSIEPFVAIEPVNESKPYGRGDVWTATAMAVSTESGYPEPYTYARTCVQMLEQKRQQDPDWYWLTSDYAVAVSDQAMKRHVEVRLVHADGITSDEVQRRIAQSFSGMLSSKPIEVMVLCQQGPVSLMRAAGSSQTQRSLSAARMPMRLTGAGHELKHPANLGQWYARAIARECVRSKQLQSVVVELDWYPLESKPRQVRAIDAQGNDLSHLIDSDRCDLASPPQGWSDPALLTKTIDLPWER